MEKSSEKRNTFFRLFGFLKQWRFSYFASLIVISLFMAVDRPFLAYIFKEITNSVIEASMTRLSDMLIAVIIYSIIWNPGFIFAVYIWAKSVISAIAGLRQTIFNHIQRLPLAYHEKRHSGDILSVISSDIAVVENAFGGIFYTLMATSFSGIAALVYMLFLNWQLALLAVAVNLIVLFINIAFAKPLRRIGSVIQENIGATSGRLADLLAGYNVIRTFSLKDWILKRFDNANFELYRNSMRRVRLNSMLAGANSFGMGLNVILTTAVVMYMVLLGKTQMGTYAAYIIVTGSIQRFINQIGTTISEVQRSLAAADRIIDVLDSPPEPESYIDIKSETKQQLKTDRLIEFNKVSFTYEQDKSILQDMTFDVAEGQVTAFVGPSGGGKSTVFKLLLGCYPVRNGGVFVKGKSVNIYQLIELRDLFAYIPQDAYLYAGTIMDNIRYGRLNASDDDVMAAAKAAYAHDFISKFPDGYDTLAGERGARLSGGERQRIAIARALLKDAPILLLDEATSSLDSESEELVQRALQVLMKGRTALTIAHRLSTIEHADVIYTIDEGKVVESGNHGDLLERKGLYSRLYNIQFRDEADMNV